MKKWLDIYYKWGGGLLGEIQYYESLNLIFRSEQNFIDLNYTVSCQHTNKNVINILSDNINFSFSSFFSGIG